jgi:hypothetical protein
LSWRVTAIAATAKASFQFDEVDIFVAVPAGLGQQLLDGIDWRHHYPFRLNTADCLRDDASHGPLAKSLRVAVAGHHQSGRAIVRAWGVSGGYGAVFLKAGFKRASASMEVSSRGDSSYLITTGSPFFCGLRSEELAPRKSTICGRESLSGGFRSESDPALRA